MQEKNPQYVVFLLSRLKTALNITRDVELSAFLGVSTQAISSWKSRNTVDYSLIFAKCGNIDLNWLIRGDENTHSEYFQEKNESPIKNLLNPQLNPQSTPQSTSEVKGVMNSLPVIVGSEGLTNSGSGTPYYASLPVSAGDMVSYLQQSRPASYINLPQIAGCTAVLPVYGSSMKGVIEQGDLIAVKEVKNREEFDPSEPCLVITEEHRMVKYLRVDDTDQAVIWAESTNHTRIRLNADNIKMVYAIKCVIRFF